MLCDSGSKNRKQYRNNKKFNETIRKRHQELMWFTINVIATSTNTEINNYHYKPQRLQK